MLGMSWPWNWGGSKTETIGKTIQEAAEQTYAKKAKLSTALESAFVQDFAENLAMSRDNVQAYTAKKVPGISASSGAAGKGGADMGDIIVADNIRYDNSRTGGAWRSIAAIVLGLGTLAAMTSALPVLLKLSKGQDEQTVAPAERELIIDYSFSMDTNTIEFQERKPE